MVETIVLIAAVMCLHAFFLWQMFMYEKRRYANLMDNFIKLIEINNHYTDITRQLIEYYPHFFAEVCTREKYREIERLVKDVKAHVRSGKNYA